MCSQSGSGRRVSSNAMWLKPRNMRTASLPVSLSSPRISNWLVVTFFFNGGVEKQFPNEDRDLIPSPKVATYDQDPKMSAQGVADRVSERISGGQYEFLMLNFAPPDMVGHT